MRLALICASGAALLGCAAPERGVDGAAVPLADGSAVSAGSKPIRGSAASSAEEGGLANGAALPQSSGSAKAEPRSAEPAPLGKYWLAQLPRGTTQLLLSRTPSWGATSARLRRYEQRGSSWQQLGPEISAVVGKTGLGWGRGIHTEQLGEPRKQEGDGRAPAGLFKLNGSYGHGPHANAKGGLPHTPVGSDWRCVDDSRSQFYGQLLSTQSLTARGLKPDWNSAERLQRADELYELLVWVDHNPQPALPGAGSCIFLHTWRAARHAGRFRSSRAEQPGEGKRPTVGCTAMDRADLVGLVQWLKPGAVLAQLPEHEVARN